MKKRYLTFALCCTATQVLWSQVSYLSQPDVAVFYPAAYQAERLAPSFALLKELHPWGELAAQWRLRPAYSQEDEKTVISIPVDEGCDLYGTGEVLGNLRRNGTNVSLWNTDNYTYAKWQGKQLYQSHPWVLGVRKDGTAFGVIIDSTWKMEIDLKNEIRVISDGPAPRVVVIEEKTPQDVVRKLMELTGRIELPPLWALGYQQARFSYFPDTKVKELVDTFREKQIPCDVIWMDIDYMDKRKVFTFNPQLFPDPAGLNKYLHGLGFKTVYMVDPGIKKDSTYATYQSGELLNAWIQNPQGQAAVGPVWPGDCVFPDYTRPDVRKWWAGLNSEFVKLGIDGVWNDMNEPAVFNGTSMTLPEDCRHLGGDGLPADVHARYHNVYGLLMIKSTLEGIRQGNPGKRPFVLSRANYLGGQRFGATWTGDNASTWDYLRCSIPMSLNLSLSGQPFNGPDVGGFSGDTNAELLSSWMALGAYYPFFRNHAADNAIHQEPWCFGSETENISRTAVNRRYRLLPYLYTLFQKASTKGDPIMQPLFFADPTDLSLRQEQQCFLLGEDLMVIPCWAQSPALPQGDWDILQMEKKDDGVQPYLALRAGAILPMGKVIQNTTEYRNDSITVYVNPDSQDRAQGLWYADAGEGLDYQHGAYAMIKFEAQREEKNLVVNATQTDGQEALTFNYRVAYVRDHAVTYSDWTLSNTPVRMKWQADKQQSIDTKKLRMQSHDFQSKDLNFMMERKHEKKKGMELY